MGCLLIGILKWRGEILERLMFNFLKKLIAMGKIKVGYLFIVDLINKDLRMRLKTTI